jgi:hypothetical protein
MTDEGPEKEPGIRSGLRNPRAAVRGAAAGALALEALVLLLAIQPLRVLGGHLSGTGIAVVVVLAVVCVLLAGMLRHPWAWYAAFAPQVVLIVAGFFVHAALTVLGIIFTLVWLYVLNVRRSVLR